MPTLRLTQHTEADATFRVVLELLGGVRQTAEASFAFDLTEDDEKDLRWYLEDYLQWPQHPAPKIAARVEGRMEELGTGLFQAVFQANDDTRELWSAVRHELASTRVEVVTGVDGATALPWELLRDPRTETSLALHAGSFVRAQPTAARRPRLPDGEDGRVRILLVICRPGGEDDVPFRSVAARIVKGLDESARDAFELDVLRPPTFEGFAEALRRAHQAGRPYHVVHFDGHGAHLDLAGDEPLELDARRFSSQVYPRTARPGRHGYLVFENPEIEDNQRLVDGPELAELLVETGVPVLILNACRSAHAEASGGDELAVDASDPHRRARAWGSLAQEVMDAGVCGVVAMRYNVYVVTAAQFVADLYASLVRGRTLGEAVTLGRKQLHAEPLRALGFEALPLQDWTVPVVYEAAPIALFPETTDDGKLTIRLTDDTTSSGSLDPDLPPTPDAGFFGRDETLLALDRAFDRHQIVLLHAYAGSGKTATVAEFARWYALTGGVEGPVLFTSFEQYLPLARVLDRVGQTFGQMLEQSGVHWLALDDATRRQVALQVLAQVPVLWIWDNVEPVTGFPSGTESAWSEDEQRELVGFLRAARDTKARFVLTSRRDERDWLGDLPARIAVPPMPLTERVRLASALAAKVGRPPVVMKEWRPLLDFSAGNPLTLTVLVGQALRDGIEGKNAVGDFVRRLRTGEAAFEDEAGEGRSRSLGASLGYGFEHAFDEEERRRLALLHLFQGFVDVDALKGMGEPEASWCLPEVRGLSRDDGIALLDRAAEVGLLRRQGGGYYGIHPALPWFFRGLFERFYAGSKEAAVRAFVEAMGELGNYYWRQYEDGNRDVIDALRAEEANLLQARRLARVHGWWNRVTGNMQGLRILYAHTGRRAEWKRLVEEIVPDFIDPGTEGPLAGREEKWGLVNEYRVRLAYEERNWAEAERLQQADVAWERQRAAPFLNRARESLDGEERNSVRSLAVSVETLGHIRREMMREECVSAYQEAIDLFLAIGAQQEAAAIAFNLGHAYKDLSAIRDLDKAEHWYRRGLELTAEQDRMGRGRCLGQLGSVAIERFQEARSCKSGEDELLRRLNEAVGFYHQALEFFPADAVDDLAVTHGELGNIYQSAGDLDRALPHYRDAIRYREKQGNVYDASGTRFNVAVGLEGAGRLQDALAYARAALRGFESYGESAGEMIQRARQLVEEIEEGLRRGTSPQPSPLKT